MKSVPVRFSSLLKRGKSTLMAVIGRVGDIDVLVNWKNMLIERTRLMHFTCAISQMHDNSGSPVKISNSKAHLPPLCVM